MVKREVGKKFVLGKTDCVPSVRAAEAVFKLPPTEIHGVVPVFPAVPEQAGTPVREVNIAFPFRLKMSGRAEGTALPMIFFKAGIGEGSEQLCRQQSLQIPKGRSIVVYYFHGRKCGVGQFKRMAVQKMRLDIGGIRGSIFPHCGNMAP